MTFAQFIYGHISTRHGQSEYNAIGRIGGDSGLSDHGIAYAKALAEFVDKKVG
jgi:broad specificity phosphatase PhoE